MTASTRLWLLTALPALLSCGSGSAGGEVVSLRGAQAGREPEFSPRQVTRVTGVEGRSVTLHCRVLYLGDKAVSWVRVRDLQILTHSGAVFTADARVSAPAPPPPRSRHAAAPQTHALRIDRLRAADAGRYECQLNTEPKMSLFFDLSVIDEAEAETTTEAETPEPSPWEGLEVEMWAEGGGRVRARAGGAAELACGARVLAAPHRAAPPLDIRWVRAGKPLTLQEGWSVSRQAGATSASSRLRLERVGAADAGEYACTVGARQATLQLDVTQQESFEEIEAMQRDGVSSPGGNAARAQRGSRARATIAALTLLIIRYV